jgi:hypothetical protein
MSNEPELTREGTPQKAYVVIERLVGHQEYIVYAHTVKEARARYRPDGLPTENKIDAAGVTEVRRLPSEDGFNDA